MRRIGVGCLVGLGGVVQWLGEVVGGGKNLVRLVGRDWC